MDKRLFLVFIIVVTCIFSLAAHAQEGTDKKKLLEAMNIYPYPSLENLKDNKLKNEWLVAVPLSSDDVDSAYSNYNDLQWLQPIAREKKVILIGENHYYQTIQHLRNRIIFALNTWDCYPLIVFEHQYSSGAFLDHFIGIKDDTAAHAFYSKACYNFVLTIEDSVFLEHLRRWNRESIGKRIHIGYSDIEHDYKATLRDIVLPYFQQVDTSFRADMDTMSLLHLGKLIPRLDGYLKIAEKKKLVGHYEFITPGYIACVIENLRSTFKAYRFDFSYYRQKAMIRNLTEKRFLGEFFRKGKVVIHGGGYHAVTHFPYPDGGNFYREGSYLSFDFTPTRGRTYSIMMWGQAYSFGETVKTNLDSSLFPKKTGYGKTVDQFQRAYKQGLVTLKDFYLMGGWEIDEYDKLIFKTGYKHNNEPFLVKSIDWSSIIATANEISPDFYQTMTSTQDQLDMYDATIYVPCSPIIRAKSMR